MTTDLQAHPLVQHYLSILRQRSTPAPDFRRASSAVTRLLALQREGKRSVVSSLVWWGRRVWQWRRIALQVLVNGFCVFV